MITSVKKLLGEQEENLGKWVKVSMEEREAILESLPGENMVRASQGKLSLRLYHQDSDYIVVCTIMVPAETHPDQKTS